MTENDSTRIRCLRFRLQKMLTEIEHIMQPCVSCHHAFKFPIDTIQSNAFDIFCNSSVQEKNVRNM